MTRRKVDLLVLNAEELVTLKGGSKKPFTGKQMTNLEAIRHGGLAVDHGKIVAIGKTQKIRSRFEGKQVIDASGKLVMPGFVDPHTHLVFAGSRDKEFELRIKGASYLEILKKGGGILQTVRETRKASLGQLVETCEKTLDTMLTHGTTTVEAKSGYGLCLKGEMKILEAIKRLNRQHPVSVVPTFMGAHAVPQEYEGRAEDYVELVSDEMIPKIAEKKLAKFCDVFCEKGVFNLEQSRKILQSGKKHGLAPKIHADELSRLGGTELAAEVGAISVEHMIFSSEDGLKALAKHGIIAVLLPAASFSLMMNRYAEARKMIDLGVPVALGTDYNPSCWVESMQIVIAFACRELKMSPAEAITAATINAAHAIGRAGEVGSLEAGKRADVLIVNAPNHNFLGYRFGINMVDKVIKNGVLVVEQGKMLRNPTN
ncbi:MAG: imidazolonepropionase [Candidatus Bathyarchaeia archaeon]|nr:imidazolonepropionase [Candidatus Bathyarchaeota archaeon A05DMB-4]MDH7595522.1 imidazolonepropionase [Candidatus Bathyarchaeota archaeon]